MVNETNLRIPKKYESGVKLIEKDFDGYWAYANPGFAFEATGSHTAHAETQKEFMSDLRTLSTCDCKDCLKGRN